MMIDTFIKSNAKECMRMRQFILHCFQRLFMTFRWLCHATLVRNHCFNFFEVEYWFYISFCTVRRGVNALICSVSFCLILFWYIQIKMFFVKPILFSFCFCLFNIHVSDSVTHYNGFAHFRVSECFYFFLIVWNII